MKRIEKEINFYTEVLKILTAFTLAVGGGTAGLFFKLDSPARIALFGIGLVVTAVLLISMAGIYLKIKHLLAELKDD